MSNDPGADFGEHTPMCSTSNDSRADFGDMHRDAAIFCNSNDSTADFCARTSICAITNDSNTTRIRFTFSQICHRSPGRKFSKVSPKAALYTTLNTLGGMTLEVPFENFD